MSTQSAAWTGERLTSVARAGLEAERAIENSDQANLLAAVDVAARSNQDDRAEALLKQIETQIASGGRGAASAGAGLGQSDDQNKVQALLKQRASLELKLQSEMQSRKDTDAEFAREREDHQQAIESLTFQQKKLKELQATRSDLLEQVRQLENKLRLQINETEQVNIKLQKFQESRKSHGDQAAEQAERTNALMAENEELRKKVEGALQERDSRLQTAKAEVTSAESQTADTAYAELWSRMQKQLPKVFVDTHVPNRRTFEQLCDTYVELVKTIGFMEAHVQKLLAALRQPGEQDDKLSHFHIMLKKQDLLGTLSAHLKSGRRTGNFANLLRAMRAWALAFGSGLHKAIIRAPEALRKDMNPRNWDYKKGWGDEAAIGRHYRDVAQKEIPDRFGTELKKDAADMAYKDYNDLIRHLK